jgi:hypothetical protein
MLRRVALVRTDVTEELSPSIMEALSSYETSVLTRATRSNMPEDAILAVSCFDYNLLLKLDAVNSIEMSLQFCLTEL